MSQIAEIIPRVYLIVSYTEIYVDIYIIIV